MLYEEKSGNPGLRKRSCLGTKKILRKNVDSLFLRKPSLYNTICHLQRTMSPGKITFNIPTCRCIYVYAYNCHQTISIVYVCTYLHASLLKCAYRYINSAT
jgi:hypothetical protein